MISKYGLAWLGLAMMSIAVAAQTTMTTSGDATNTVPVFTGSSTVGSSPISVSGSNVNVPILNSMVNAASSFFSGSDACAKIKAANLYAIANAIPNVDVRGFTGLQVCSSGYDIWGDLAAANATIGLVDWFGSVHIQTTTPFTITNSGLTIIGAGAFATQIEYTGTAASPVLSIGSSSPTTVAVQGVRISGIYFYGDSSNVTDVILAEGFHRSILSDILTWGATGCGIHAEFAVTNTYVAPRTSNQDAKQLGILSSAHTTPAHGLCFDQIDSSHQTTNSTVIDAAAEGLRGTGWILPGASTMTFTSGTSEDNSTSTGVAGGVSVSQGSAYNTFISLDLEGNTSGIDFSDGGASNHWRNVLASSSSAPAYFARTAFWSVLDGGSIQSLASGSSNPFSWTRFGNQQLSSSYLIQDASVGALVNNTGLQIVSGAGCTITAGAIGNSCSSANIFYPVGYNDSNATMACSLVGGNGLNTLGQISAIGRHSFVIMEIAQSTSATGGGAIKCIVSHN